MFPRKTSAGDEAEGVRVELVGATFLSPVEAGEDASAGCTTVGCSVGDWGRPGELGQMLGRLAALVATPHETATTYARRLAQAIVNLRLSGRNLQGTVWHNAYAEAFGTQPSGAFAVDGRAPTFEEIDQARRAVIDPGNATLVIAGDTSLEEAHAAAQGAFADWTPTGVTAPEAAATAAPRSGPGAVLVDSRNLVQAIGDVVVRGPKRSDPDAPAFALAGQILGVGMSSTAFRTVRESMAAAYAVGAQIFWLHQGSILVLGGALEEAKAVEALGSLLGAMRDMRDSGPADTDVARAKMALKASVRQQQASNPGVAQAIAAGVLLGGPLDECALINQVDAASSADVQRVAQKYFTEGNLHVVAVGPAEDLESSLDRLGLGPVHRRDGFAHDPKQ
jgi:predicted Zn-dependent peptidase